MTSVRYIDLHTHSTASDGSDTPSELVGKAAKAGLAAMALTDHDTLAGLDEAATAAQQCGVEFIRGCELSSLCPYGEVHLVGLWLPHVPQSLPDTLNYLREGRHERNRRIVRKLQEQGVSITYEEVLTVAKDGSVGRPHIAQILVAKNTVTSTRQAFEEFLGTHGRAYVPRVALTPLEALAALKAEGATVSFAHPMLLKAPDTWLEETISQLKDAGLDALEAYHSEHSNNDVRRCVALAHQYGLALTGGTDYHGIPKPSITLGRGKGGMRVPYTLLEELKALRKTQGLPV